MLRSTLPADATSGSSTRRRSAAPSSVRLWRGVVGILWRGRDGETFHAKGRKGTVQFGDEDAKQSVGDEVVVKVEAGVEDKDLRVFNTQWLGDDVRVNFRSYGMDPDHSIKMKKFGMTSGDRVDSRVYPEFKA